MRPVLSPLFVAAMALMFATGPALAQTPFTYQGQLQQNNAGFTGNANLDFRLFDQAAGGSQIGPTAALNNWPVQQGLFQVELDFGVGSFTGSPRYLEVRVNGSLLSPRQVIRPAPMALFALSGNQGPPGDSHWLLNGSATYYNAGNVGIGTNTPAWPLDIAASQGVIRMVSSNNGFGSVMELRNNTPTPSVLGAINFVNAAGQFRGQIAYTEAVQEGLTFRAGGIERMRINGNARVAIGTTANSSARLHVVSTDANGDYTGVLSETDNASGTAIFGVASSASGFNVGVEGNSSSTGGTGVSGNVTADSGITYGVWGSSNSISGFDFYAAGAGMNYGAASSIRWKKNVQAIPEPMLKLAGLRGVYFDWDEEHGGQHDIGMIAEEVGAVIPEVVQYEENGQDAIGMDYSKLVSLLVAAVNELKTEKDAEIVALHLELDDLHHQIAELNTP